MLNNDSVSAADIDGLVSSSPAADDFTVKGAAKGSSGPEIHSDVITAVDALANSTSIADSFKIRGAARRHSGARFQ